jgi:hypothetical protein
MNTLTKLESNVFISIDAGKAFAKNQHPILVVKAKN